MIEPGSRVIYRKTKHSRDPGPRAQGISPARYGDSYSYCVDKLWMVVGTKSPNKVIVMTRRGKQMELDADDPNLRPARLLDRIRYWGRFPRMKDMAIQKANLS